MIRVIYDGMCPFCDDYVRYRTLEANAGTVELVDARMRPEVLAEHGIDRAAMEDGMVVVWDGRLVQGAEAMHTLASLSSRAPARRGTWIPVLDRLARSRTFARLSYPLLRLGRRAVLAMRGVPRFPRD